MINAELDGNGRQTAIALLDTDGTTIVRITSTANNSLNISDGTTGTDHGNHADLDENGRSVLYALSSTDGKTLVALYCDSTGHLLIDSS